MRIGSVPPDVGSYRAGALVEAGDGGVEGIEATFEIGALAIERGEHLIVLLLDFVRQGKIAGADAVTDGVHAGVEFGAGDEVGFCGRGPREEFFGEGEGTGDCRGEEGPFFGLDGGGSHKKRLKS